MSVRWPVCVILTKGDLDLFYCIMQGEMIQWRMENCSQFPHIGQVCHNELQSHSSSVLNITAIPEQVEQHLIVVLTIFQSLNASPECDVAFRSFLCLYAFGSCGNSYNNMSMLTTTAICRDVRNSLCAWEWAAMEDFLGHHGLPSCEDIYEESTIEHKGTQHYIVSSLPKAITI